jgi:xylan 1,4-beta-xylosidase
MPQVSPDPRSAPRLLVLLAVLIVVLAAACAAPKPCGCRLRATASNREARFDWFEYEGRDPVCERLRPTADQYVNPILAGFYPDPSVVRDGEDYYLVTSSFAYFPGVPIFHSRDLVHFTQLGHVLDRPAQLDLDGLAISEGIFAPTLRYHQGTFYLITTRVGGGRALNFVVTAHNPAGPWSDPIVLPAIDGVDPSLFFEDDGRAYVVWSGKPPAPPRYEGHMALWLQEFDWRAQKLVGARRLLVDGGVAPGKSPRWIEGPHLFKTHGAYYLIAAEGGTEQGHSEVVFRSDRVEGPWQPFAGNPILTQRHLDPGRPDAVTSTGHADFVETAAGDLWAVFLGTRPYGDDLYNTGRETFLMPVRWTEGWPIVTAGDEAVPLLHQRPALPAQPPGPLPTAGNFTIRDEFDAPALAPVWNFIRTPREAWYDLRSTPGWLSLRPRPVALGQRGNPSFIGLRQQHGHAVASAAMAYLPAKAGDRAGLVAFQNDDFYYFLGLALADGTPVIEVERHAKLAGTPTTTVLAWAALSPAAGGQVFLKIEARGGAYDFSYAYDPARWLALVTQADGTLLSTKVAGGFVGTYLGMYAYTDGT